jgi:hypothetical protein
VTLVAGSNLRTLAPLRLWFAVKLAGRIARMPGKRWAEYGGPVADSRDRSSLWSYRSNGSILSAWSDGSILSVGSVGSIASVGSVGSSLSAFSVGSSTSVGSLLSNQSNGSILSHQSNCSVLADGSQHRPGAAGPGDTERWLAPVGSLATLGLAFGMVALIHRRLRTR